MFGKRRGSPPVSTVGRVSHDHAPGSPAPLQVPGKTTKLKYRGAKAYLQSPARGMGVE